MRQHCVHDTIQDQAQIAGTQAADEAATHHVKDDYGATTALIDA